MLSQLPDPIRLGVLFLTGAVVGAAINWAIYRLAIFCKRDISPWQPGGANQRTWLDRIPIVGWLQLRRESAAHGKGFWIRPLLIELVWAVGLPFFWLWQFSGGITGGVAPVSLWPSWPEIWFWGHAVLLALLFVATFIDFDEKTIPDGVTVTGTLFALAIAAVAPSFRLPVVTPGLAAVPTVSSLHFNSPQTLPAWHHEWIGLAISLGLFSIWIFALLPKLIPLEGKLSDRWQFMWASILRPNRKTVSKHGTAKRRPRMLTRVLAGIWLVGAVAIPVLWATLPSLHWTSFLGAVVGLGFGGALVWGIRIIGGLALNQEAMGFGDVTLLAMIGAFLGWQSTLVAFVFAFIAGLVFALVNFLIRKENELAFGPYICLGAVINLFFWPELWQFASRRFFAVGSLYLASVLLVGGLAMYPMLMFVRWIKNMILPFEEEEA